MKRKITELIIILFFYIMQVSAARVISIANISPNWLIIMPVFLAFSVVRMMECLQVFCWNYVWFVLFRFVRIYSAYFYLHRIFSGFFNQKYEVREVLIPLALVITADFGYGFISYIGNFLLQNRLNVGFFMSRFILPEVVYTSLVSLLIYHPIHYFCVITEQGKERKKKGKIDERSVWVHYKSS